ncbi:hypothetical protein [Muricoccus aerilatus]|uniref:hypothetical protein n=1 Tax=Muricoccus aerilatus TaxID=452982 RepID=UPI000A9B23E6|nr:hypothetical protein [Roseomonas aerilata]
MSEEIKPIPGVGGIPPADRIFSLLEQEFPVADVLWQQRSAPNQILGSALTRH